MKRTLAALAIAASSITPVFAQEVEPEVNAEAKLSWTEAVTVFTLLGQNTNGEDLKCARYNGGYSGGLSCNWTAPKPPQ
jgi:hypothetical protein